jgi:hypothetical protein
MRPVGAAPLPEVHFNAHNNNKKFSGKKFKGISRGNGRSRILRKARVLATTRTLSRKIMLMTTLKLVRGAVVTITERIKMSTRGGE